MNNKKPEKSSCKMHMVLIEEIKIIDVSFRYVSDGNYVYDDMYDKMDNMIWQYIISF